MTRSAISGIYSITHKADGKVYVGQSRDIAKRIRHHRDYDQDCTHLCNAINLYGWDAFEVAVLEEVDDYNLLNDREQYWMDTLEAYNPKKGYNILRWADGKATRTKPEAMKPNRMIFPKLYKLPEAARILGKHTATIKRWHEQNLISLVELPGGHFRVPESEVKRLAGIEQEPQEAS